MFNQRYWAPRYWANRYWAPVGLTSQPGYYWAGSYWTASNWSYSYWAKQSDSNPFVATTTTGLAISAGVTLGSFTVLLTNDLTATVTSGLAINAGIGINAATSMAFGNAFIAAAPLELSVSTSIAITATPVLGFAASAGVGFYWASRYWSAKYWAPRYWETQVEFEATVTAGLSVATTANISATPQQALTADVLFSLPINSAISIGATFESSEAQPQAPQTAVSGGWGMRPLQRKPKKKKAPVAEAVVYDQPRAVSEATRKALEPKTEPAKPADLTETADRIKRKKAKELLLL